MSVNKKCDGDCFNCIFDDCILDYSEVLKPCYNQSKDATDDKRKEYLEQYRKKYYISKRDYFREYAKRNKDKIKKYQKKYRLENADKVRKYQREYMAKYRERMVKER